MDEQQRRRYNRQTRLPQVNTRGQQKLLDSTVLIMGMGGLGSPAALYLAASGVGHLVLNDFDQVELSNLQRQIIHGTSDIGEPKVSAARARILGLNPDVEVTALNGHLDGDDLVEQAARADLVLDCSDNFPTRFAVNAACFQAVTPLVSGAAIRFEGQVSVFNPKRAESPCYRCLYEEEGEAGESCSEGGILAPVVGIIGSIQALEAIKIILDIGTSLCGRLMVLDGETLEWRSIKLRKNPDCPVCSRY